MFASSLTTRLRAFAVFMGAFGFTAGCGTPLKDDVSPPPQALADQAQPTTESVGESFKGWGLEDWKAWLAPPPADQPQPKLTCAAPEMVVESAWRLQEVVYVWEIGNAGQGPLQLRLLP